VTVPLKAPQYARAAAEDPMKYFPTAVLALALAIGLAGAAGAQSMATPGPTPSSWPNAVPGPIGPAQPYIIEGYGSSAPPVTNAPMTSPGNPVPALGAGGITTGGQMMAR
jgi:hypothetical protein